MNISLTDEQIKLIRDSLKNSIDRADERAALAIRKGFHDAEAENAFYVKLSRDCRDAIASLDAQTATTPEADDEECCPECGEDCGFCQCED